MFWIILIAIILIAMPLLTASCSSDEQIGNEDGGWPQDQFPPSHEDDDLR